MSKSTDKNNSSGELPLSMGELLKQQRVKLGMSQTKLAKLAGTTQATVSAIENGQSLSVRLYIKLCKGLGLKPPDLSGHSQDGEIFLHQPREPVLRELLSILATLEDDQVFDLLQRARKLRARRTGEFGDEPIQNADVGTGSKGDPR